MDNNKITYILRWSAVLSVFWLLLSGYLKPLLLAFGVISVLLVVVCLRRMDKVDSSARAVPFRPWFFIYLGWLCKKIVLSSISVAHQVWRRHSTISPTLAKLPISDIPARSRVLYANSVTLTPGTLSIDMDENEITIHALEEPAVKALRASSMASRIVKIGE